MEVLKTRDSLLTEKAINVFVGDYNEQKEIGSLNAETNFKLRLISFITDNEKNCVSYGIEYLKFKYPELYKIVAPIVLEYQMYGLEPFVDNVEDDTMTAMTSCECEQEDNIPSTVELIKLLFIRLKEKLVRW